jgi:hypothetical protein
MSQSAKCQRCILPIVGTSFVLRLDSQPPRPDALEVLLCENCVESMSLWLTRRNRRPEGFETGVTAPTEQPRSAERRGRGRDVHSEALDRFESDSRRRLFLGLFFGTILLAVIGVATVLAIVGNSSLKPRPAPNESAAEAP